MTDDRDDRQAQIYGREGLELLRSLRVAIVGVGLVGGGVGLHLGLLGIRTLLVDPGIVEPVNLANQFFTPADVGESKARVRADQIRALSPGAQVDWVAEPLEALGLGAWDDVDLLVGGLDGRSARVRLGQISQLLGLPYLDMGVDGSGARLQASVSLYDPRVPGSCCHACRYDGDDLAKIRLEGRGPGCLSWARTGAPETPPTYMASAFASAVSGLAATWAIDVLLGNSVRPANTQLQIFADAEPRVRSVALERYRQCPMPHEPLGELTRVSTETVGQLFDRASQDLSAAPAALRFHNRTFSEELFCPTSNDVRALPRLIEAYREQELICGCRSGARFVPQSPRSRLSAEDVTRYRDRRWRELGLPSQDVITATTHHGREAHYIVG